MWKYCEKLLYKYTVSSHINMSYYAFIIYTTYYFCSGSFPVHFDRYYCCLWTSIHCWSPKRCQICFIWTSVKVSINHYLVKGFSRLSYKLGQDSTWRNFRPITKSLRQEASIQNYLSAIYVVKCQYMVNKILQKPYSFFFFFLTWKPYSFGTWCLERRYETWS